MQCNPRSILRECTGHIHYKISLQLNQFTTLRTMAPYTTLSLVVCLYNDVTALDYQGPLELFGSLQERFIENPFLPLPSTPKYAIKITYAGHSTKVIPFAGPTVNIEEHNTYDQLLSREDKEQFDIILVPGG